MKSLIRLHTQIPRMKIWPILPGQYNPAGPSSSLPTSNGYGLNFDGQVGSHTGQGNPGLNLASDTLLPGTFTRSCTHRPHGSNLGLTGVAVPGTASQAYLDAVPGSSYIGIVPE